MAEHTPGPWTFDGEYVESLEADTPLSIATIADCGSATVENGRLISAAPDLLAALKIAMAVLEENDLDEAMAGEYELLADAIAKAEGTAAE